MSTTTLRLLFTIEGRTLEDLPSHRKLAESLVEALPKEIWVTDGDIADEWGLVSILEPISIAQHEDHEAARLHREIEILRDSILNLQQKNDNQRQIIDNLILDKVGFAHAIKQTLTTFGVDMGWGDDDQLCELEEVSATISDQATELAAMLNTIRTGR